MFNRARSSYIYTPIIRWLVIATLSRQLVEHAQRAPSITLLRHPQPSNRSFSHCCATNCMSARMTGCMAPSAAACRPSSSSLISTTWECGSESWRISWRSSRGRVRRVAGGWWWVAECVGSEWLKVGSGSGGVSGAVVAAVGKVVCVWRVCGGAVWRLAD
jgi:hypothetical protein